MPLLSRLVDESTLVKLHSVVPPVATAEDLLSRCSLQLSIDLKCDIHEIEAIKVKIAGSILSSTSPLQSWSDMPSSIPVLRKEGQTVKYRPSGFSSLDSLFDGGFHPGNMIQILGSSSSGKTQFVLSTAIACAKNGLKVLLLVTNNDIGVFRIRRMLDYLVAQETALSAENKHQLKLFILSHLHIQCVYDIWNALDTLCRVRELPAQFDVVIVDCMHSLIAPCLSNTDDKFNAPPPSSTAAAAASASVPIAVHFQPIVASLYAVLRGFAGGGVTVLVTNVLEKSRGRGPGSAAAAAAAPSAAPCGTGSMPPDVFDHCIVMSSNNNSSNSSTSGDGVVGQSSSDSCFTAGEFTLVLVLDCYLVFLLVLALRPPQFNGRPSQCELRIPRI